METVSDLSGLGCTYSGTLRVKPVAIAADDFDPRVLTQPLRERGGGAIRQHVGHRSGLKIHEDRSACGASAPSPLINANNSQLPSLPLSLCPTLEMPENSIAAHHHAKAGEQP